MANSEHNYNSPPGYTSENPFIISSPNWDEDTYNSYDRASIINAIKVTIKLFGGTDLACCINCNQTCGQTYTQLQNTKKGKKSVITTDKIIWQSLAKNTPRIQCSMCAAKPAPNIDKTIKSVKTSTSGGTFGSAKALEQVIQILQHPDLVGNVIYAPIEILVNVNGNLAVLKDIDENGQETTRTFNYFVKYDPNYKEHETTNDSNKLVGLLNAKKRTRNATVPKPTINTPQTTQIIKDQSNKDALSIKRILGIKAPEDSTPAKVTKPKNSNNKQRTTSATLNNYYSHSSGGSSDEESLTHESSTDEESISNYSATRYTTSSSYNQREADVAFAKQLESFMNKYINELNEAKLKLQNYEITTVKLIQEQMKLKKQLQHQNIIIQQTQDLLEQTNKNAQNLQEQNTTKSKNTKQITQEQIPNLQTHQKNYEVPNSPPLVSIKPQKSTNRQSHPQANSVSPPNNQRTSTPATNPVKQVKSATEIQSKTYAEVIQIPSQNQLSIKLRNFNLLNLQKQQNHITAERASKIENAMKILRVNQPQRKLDTIEKTTGYNLTYISNMPKIEDLSQVKKCLMDLGVKGRILHIKWVSYLLEIGASTATIDSIHRSINKYGGNMKITENINVAQPFTNKLKDQQDGETICKTSAAKRLSRVFMRKSTPDNWKKFIELKCQQLDIEDEFKHQVEENIKYWERQNLSPEIQVVTDTQPPKTTSTSHIKPTVTIGINSTKENQPISNQSAIQTDNAIISNDQMENLQTAKIIYADSPETSPIINPLRSPKTVEIMHLLDEALELMSPAKSNQNDENIQIINNKSRTATDIAGISL